MNKELFFNNYPKRKDDSNKFDNGRVLFISGSFGMAGAAILNIIGARSVGCGYIHSLLPESIYPIVASKQITTVYHPDKCEDKQFLNKLDIYKKVDAIGFGSGLTNHPFQKDYLIDILNNYNNAIVIDAQGLHILSEDINLFKLNSNIIITPHLGEFSLLTRTSIDEIEKDKENIASNYAKRNNVTLILKGPNTLIVSNEGNITVNNSGNQALATAGSGDVLAGIITGLCSKYDDHLKACIDGVWLHGYLADEAIKKHSVETLKLEDYIEYADDFFKENR